MSGQLVTRSLLVKCVVYRVTVRCLAVVIGTIDCVHDAGRRSVPLYSIRL